MSKPSFREAAGEPISSDQLTIRRAHEFAQLIQSDVTPYVTVFECRKVGSGNEVVVIDVRPTVPQLPKVPIRRLERVSVEFDGADSRYPDVRALRENFPRERVLHLNGGFSDNEPASLCLFAEPWPDVRLRLTANELLFRLQNWFDDTATGKLHREDQPLEPTFLVKPYILIVGENIIERMSKGDFGLNLDSTDFLDQLVFIEHGRQRFADSIGRKACVLPVISKPYVHVSSPGLPLNVLELHRHLEQFGINLIEKIQFKLLSLGDQIDKYSYLLIFASLQRQRAEGCEPEPELLAFACVPPDQNAQGLGWLLAAVGLARGGAIDLTKRGDSVGVAYLSVRYELSASSAANFSGLETIQGSFVAVGAGALGSQFLMTAVRGGIVDWTVIDNDVLLPHNLVRHSLPGHWLGHSKAEALARQANSVLDKPCVIPVIADVLSPQKHQPEIDAALNAADAIVDLSASVAVSRYLACDLEGSARRCSIFVSPSGKDLIFLGEDVRRTHRLDMIEAQYYRNVARNQELNGHLRGGDLVGSCRDITSRVPQHLMAIHAAQAEKIFRSWFHSLDATAIVLRAAADSFAFEQVSLSLGTPLCVGDLGGWTVITDAALLDDLYQQRQNALPNETGGVLLAHVDAQRHTLYVCHHIPAPADSQRQPTVYIRGSEGLEAEYARVREDSLNTLAYIGEWHSHPDGYSCLPSAEDMNAGAWLAGQTRPTSLPGIMLIIGDERQACWMLCQQENRLDAPITLSLGWGEKQIDLPNKNDQ